MLKKYKPFIIFFYVASTLSLIAAAFFDLKLDILLNNTENPIALWFRNTGEIPGRMVCPLAGAVLFYTSEKTFQKIFALIVNIGGSAYLGYYLGKYFFNNQFKMPFSIIFGIGIGICILYAISFIKIPENIIPIIRKIAFWGIIIMFVQISAIEGLKYLWGRVRFRDLLAAGSYEQFTPWYQINGINGNKSFPSGHTAGAGMSYMMMFFPFLSEKWNKKYPLCFIIPCIYTSIVAFTRLVMGAHYLSDVTAGGIVSFSIVLIFIHIYEKSKHKKSI